MSFNSESTNQSMDSGKGRFKDLRRRLSIQIQNFIEISKQQSQQAQKENANKGKVYTSMEEVQCMKDVKSQNGFYHEYELGKKLGQGCHSTVYKCIQKENKKPYAVKLTKQKDLEIFNAIRQGYRILKKLQHENIVQAKSLFIDQKYMTCFMVIEYCEWENLSNYIKRANKIEKQEASVILTQILKAISYMHTAGVCHRDLKPDNILYDPVKRKLKIIDFDLARIKKFTNSKLEMMTKTGCLSYRAPEIFGAIYDEKVDIWAVGVIAYQLLTGQQPFYSEYQEDQIHKIREQEPNYENVSLWQKDLLQKLLCKDPQRRSTASQALTSPFFLVNTKLVQSPNILRTMIKSPSAGKEEFERGLRPSFESKFFDDDVTSMFLGGGEGDIGVVRFVQGSDEQQSD